MYLTVEGKTEVIQASNANPYQLEAETFSRAILGQGGEWMPLSQTIQNLQTLESLYHN